MWKVILWISSHGIVQFNMDATTVKIRLYKCFIQKSAFFVCLFLLFLLHFTKTCRAQICCWYSEEICSDFLKFTFMFYYLVLYIVILVT